VTDSESAVRYDPENKKGVSNLMSIYSALTGKGYGDIETEFEGKGYGIFKPAVAEVACAALSPIRNTANELLADRGYLETVYYSGAERAAQIADETVAKVYDKLGFVKRGSVR